MSTTIINPTNLLALMKAQVQIEMEAAAEPMIQQALRDIEKSMRAKVRTWAVAHIEQSFDMYAGRDKLTITINQGPQS